MLTFPVKNGKIKLSGSLYFENTPKKTLSQISYSSSSLNLKVSNFSSDEGEIGTTVMQNGGLDQVYHG